MDVAISRFYFSAFLLVISSSPVPFLFQKARENFPQIQLCHRYNCTGRCLSIVLQTLLVNTWDFAIVGLTRQHLRYLDSYIKKTGAPSPWPQVTCIIAKAIHNSVVCRNFFHNHCVAHCLQRTHLFWGGVVSCFFTAFMKSARFLQSLFVP
jgi:hypothetical protein